MCYCVLPISHYFVFLGLYQQGHQQGEYDYHPGPVVLSLPYPASGGTIVARYVSGRAAVVKRYHAPLGAAQILNACSSLQLPPHILSFQAHFYLSKISRR